MKYLGLALSVGVLVYFTPIGFVIFLLALLSLANSKVERFLFGSYLKLKRFFRSLNGNQRFN